jgi:hypothetical protein
MEALFCGTARATLSPIAGRFPISEMNREGLGVISIRAQP